jgi:hypothetical protein
MILATLLMRRIMPMAARTGIRLLCETSDCAADQVEKIITLSGWLQ